MMKADDIILYALAALAAWYVSGKFKSGQGSTYYAGQNSFGPPGSFTAPGTTIGPSGSIYPWDILNAAPNWLPRDPIYSPSPYANGGLILNDYGGSGQVAPGGVIV